MIQLAIGVVTGIIAGFYIKSQLSKIIEVNRSKAELRYYGSLVENILVISGYPSDPTVHQRAELIEQKLKQSENCWNLNVEVMTYGDLILEDGKHRSGYAESWLKYLVRVGQKAQEMDVANRRGYMQKYDDVPAYQQHLNGQEF